ncbi:putative lumazine-binding protein [Mucilaginibacter oryzae]|uniref:Putative lumazine-binding protein n=2 Tax=Mucilaginibacter oryzae TaxID=468058 RepID=A0A316H4F8_9SPHI|nr:putative lumazine-binding protein [Mucilaginibacter oryzae]
MLGLALLVAGATANAATKIDGENLTKNFAINTYIDAMTRGKLSGFSEVVDPSAKFSMLRGTKVLSFDKMQVVDQLKATKNTEQDCVTSTSVVESNNDLAVVKVDMKYSTFTRSNYVTITNTGSGWKITNVYSVFK